MLVGVVLLSPTGVKSPFQIPKFGGWSWAEDSTPSTGARLKKGSLLAGL